MATPWVLQCQRDMLWKKLVLKQPKATFMWNTYIQYVRTYTPYIHKYRDRLLIRFHLHLPTIRFCLQIRLNLRPLPTTGIQERTCRTNNSVLAVTNFLIPFTVIATDFKTRKGLIVIWESVQIPDINAFLFLPDRCCCGQSMFLLRPLAIYYCKNPKIMPQRIFSTLARLIQC